MACYTVVSVELTDEVATRLARKHLKLPETGLLTIDQAQAVRIEAGIIRTHRALQKLAPNAVIRRQGDKLTVSVGR